MFLRIIGTGVLFLLFVWSKRRQGSLVLYLGYLLYETPEAKVD
jgi:hypothetical protein